MQFQRLEQAGIPLHLKTKYGHIDALFGDNVIDWDLIEKHWPDLLRAGISIREGRLYKALRELGRVIRTITLLRFLSEPELRARSP